MDDTQIEKYKGKQAAITAVLSLILMLSPITFVKIYDEFRCDNFCSFLGPMATMSALLFFVMTLIFSVQAWRKKYLPGLFPIILNIVSLIIVYNYVVYIIENLNIGIL